MISSHVLVLELLDLLRTPVDKAQYCVLNCTLTPQQLQGEEQHKIRSQIGGK